jgi:hypothetical protein
MSWLKVVWLFYRFPDRPFSILHSQFSILTTVPVVSSRKTNAIT